MNYLSLVKEDYENNLDGIGVSLFVSGCEDHPKCPGCHNPESWDKNAGQPFTNETYEELIDALSQDYISAFTLTGGDPMSMCNRDEVSHLVLQIRHKFGDKIRIWLYTGFEFEDFEPDFLHLFDVIIFGPFVQEERDYTCKIRGSKNQRICAVTEDGFIFCKDENDYTRL